MSHLQLVQIDAIILSTRKSAKKSISLSGRIISPPIWRSVCKIYGVIWRVDCFVRSECGHHDVAEAQQHTQHECI